MTGDSWSESCGDLAEPGIRGDTDVGGRDARRVNRWNREFEGTNWIAFACAGFLLLCFVPMLVINETTVQRAGATIGSSRRAYLVGSDRESPADWVEPRRDMRPRVQGATGTEAAGRHGSARTILLMMLGCALLNSPGDWLSWTLQAVSQLGAESSCTSTSVGRPGDSRRESTS